MTVEQLAAYELIEKQQIPEMNSVGYLLRHKKTGARVALLSNDDENKVFNIGFRTPPSRQYGCTAYYGTFRTLRFHRFPGEGSVCGTGEGFPEYVPECHDLPGQDSVSGSKLQ